MKYSSPLWLLLIEVGGRVREMFAQLLKSSVEYACVQGAIRALQVATYMGKVALASGNHTSEERQSLIGGCKVIRRDRGGLMQVFTAFLVNSHSPTKRAAGAVVLPRKARGASACLAPLGEPPTRDRDA
jgi:hypothetical protein